MKKKRCEAQNHTGTQCSRVTDIGAGLCSWHLSCRYRLCIKKFTIKIKNRSIGLGLFTTNPNNKKELVFRKNEFILSYNGEVVTKKELNKRYGDYTAPYSIGGPLEDRYGKYSCPYNNAARQRCTSSLLNHATGKHANCMFHYNVTTKIVKIVAIKNIYTNEELFCDYGEKYTFVGNFVTLKSTQPKSKWFKFGDVEQQHFVLCSNCGCDLWYL